MDPLDQTSRLLPPPAPAPTFVNRRPWLIVFGVFEILIAFLLVGMGLLMVAVPQDALRQAQARQQPGAPQISLLSLAAIYAAMATVWLVVAIGTIMAKNWARIISLVLSYFWLSGGVVATLLLALILPEVARQQPNAAAASTTFVMAFTLTFMVILMVLVPGVFLLFFHNKNVRATCEATDIGISNKRPTIMYVLIVLFVLTLIGVPFTLFSGHPILLFGTLLWGTAKVVAMTIYLLAEIIALWGFIKVDLRGWWAALFITALWMLSTLVTLARGNITSLYERMGFAASTRMLQGKILIFGLVIGLLYVIGKLAAIIYSRRYFAPASTPLQSEPAR